ncbi:hypothetical protein L2E82_22167 [Cichorium intybus]|uniref:Uncharacterized protein n=1 Tax=Cichorium intybus TaxID=13427 RepID=A0ACB9DY05_CICIN|nr:hypothetical protein L2E82_22167 [Cichorium intybus]
MMMTVGNSNYRDLICYAIWVPSQATLNLDEWTEEDVDNVIKLGVIEVVNSKFEDSIPENRKKPQPDSSIEERSDFIRRKYVLQQFLNMEEQLSCPLNPAAFNCSSTGINSVVEKKFCSNILAKSVAEYNAR